VSLLVLGESLIDVIQRDGAADIRTPGGGPFNVAVAAARLGASVRLLTDLGEDAQGILIRAHAERSGVEVIAAGRGETSEARARVGADGSAEYAFRVRWDPHAELLRRAAPPRALVIGSLGAILDPGSLVIDQALDRFPKALVGYDPNIRPAFIQDAAAVRRRVAELARRSSLVKLSDDDAAWLAPDRDPVEMARALSASGPALVVLTRGPAGLLLIGRGVEVEVPAPRVTVSDTVGAGDTVLASLMVALAPGGRDGLEVMAADRVGLDVLGHMAVAAAAITVSRVGADPPTKSELEEATTGRDVDIVRSAR
jgi:fructokinase